MTILPEIVNGNYDPMAQQRNMASMFQDRANNAQTEQDRVRANMIADAGLGAVISGSQLKEAQNIGELASLPQKLKIEETERNRTQKFQALSEMKRALHDPQLTPEARDLVIGRGVEIASEVNYPRPKNLKDISVGQGRSTEAARLHFLDMYRNTPDQFEAELDKAIAASSGTRESVNKINEEAMKIRGHNQGVLLHGLYPPREAGGGSANDVKVLEHYRKGLSDVRFAMDKALRADATAQSLGIIVDEAGQLKKTRDLTPVEETKYNYIKKGIEDRFGRERDAAYRMLQKVRKDYGFPSDTGEEVAPQQTKAPTNVTLSDLRKMYPGKSDADLKKAYKAKFGKDVN